MDDDAGATGGEAPPLGDKLEELLRIKRMQADVGRRNNAQLVRSNRMQVAGARRWRLVVLGVLAGIACFAAKTVYMSVARFPRLKQWWERATTDASRYAQKPASRIIGGLRDERGAIRAHYRSTVVRWGTGTEAKANIGVYQICTTYDNPPLAWLLQLFAVWRSLEQKGAHFLRAAINHLEYDNGEASGRLNLLHLSGSVHDYMHASYAQPSQIYALPDARGAADDVLWHSWQQSAAFGNIWYDLYPKTKEGLLRIRLFRDVAERRGGAEHNLKNLLDGGLVRVARAEIAQDETAAELLDRYFGPTTSTLRPSCGAQRADGALNGAIGMGMVAPGLVSGTMTLAGGVAVAGLSVAAAAAGFFVGGAASEEACSNALTR